jgi:hypothetical protein
VLLPEGAGGRIKNPGWIRYEQHARTSGGLFCSCLYLMQVDKLINQTFINRIVNSFVLEVSNKGALSIGFLWKDVYDLKCSACSGLGRMKWVLHYWQRRMYSGSFKATARERFTTIRVIVNAIRL